MKAIKLTQKRLLLEFPTKKEMNLTNFRITEFKEGTVIRGRHFTADEFIDFNSDSEGNIKYFNFWEGHNYSVEDLNHFVDKFGGEVSQREWDVVKQARMIDHDGYIISIVEGDEMTLRHEVAHGLYFENPAYKAEVDQILGEIPRIEFDFWKVGASEMGYNESNFEDELHAYLVAYDQEEWDECFPSVKLESVAEFKEKLGSIFDSYNKAPEL